MHPRFVFLILSLISCAKGDNSANSADGRPLTVGEVPGIPDLPPLPTDGILIPDLTSTTDLTMDPMGEVTTAVTTDTPMPVPTSGWDPKKDVGVEEGTTTESVHPGEVGGIDTGDSSSGGTSSGTTSQDLDTDTGWDPQPMEGLYEACFKNTDCDLEMTDGCFTIADEDMELEDGYCTILCENVNDCGLQPLNIPGTQVCEELIPAQKICAIMCMNLMDCPVGMFCKNLHNKGLFCV